MLKEILRNSEGFHGDLKLSKDFKGIQKIWRGLKIIKACTKLSRD